jgi:enterochelin esterase-like enzyme
VSGRARRVARWIALALVALAFGLALGGPARAGEVLSRSLHSAALGGELGYTVYLPEGYGAGLQRYPVLYLLHGHGGSEHDWLRDGGLRETADRLIAEGRWPALLVVMPGMGTRWWIDGNEARAQSALLDELLPQVDATLRTQATRAGRWIGGLSAGGYGVVNAVLSHPALFGAAAALSPAIYDPLPPPDSAARIAAPFQREGRFDDATWQRLNYPSRWADYAGSGTIVPLFVGSGDHDHLGIAWQSALLYQRLWRHQPQAAALRIVDGGHEWAVWRALLPEAVAFMAQQAQAAARSSGPASSAPARASPDR